VFDVDREIQDTRVRLCLDCGKCTVVCPVAQCDPDFNPRLIAQRRLGRHKNSPQDETIWSCLSCYLCVERCNYRVAFPDFISALRWEARNAGYEVKCSHGGALQALMHMMARKELHQDRLGWLPQEITLSNDCDTLFFVGCAPYFDVVFSDLGLSSLQGVKAALKLLNRAQIPFKLLDNERCCGHDLLLQGDREGFLGVARANMEEFTRHNVRRIITSCPECYYTLKVDWPKFVGDTGIQVLHLTEVIAPLVRSGSLKLGKLDKRATYHDPCMLGRCSGLYDEPRSVLRAVAGLELAEMEQSREKSLCCGASPWAHCGAVNRQVQEKLLAQAEATGAGLLVTACPKCQIHLRCAQKAGDGKIPQLDIQDLATVLAQSLD
jgi:heterodisulfide reductase subunit D